MSQIDIYYAEADVRLGTGQSLGFFGQDGFGDPLSLSEYNGRTYVTSADGSTQYEECDNCRKISSSGVIVGQTGNGINIRNLPNYLSTVNIRFTHPQAVLVQNARLIAFNGTDQGVAPVGLNVYGAEIIHTSRLQSVTGTGDTAWLLMLGSGVKLNLVDSPGTSGISPLGPATTDTRHDWYVALSVTPTVPADKTFSLRCDLEYI
jgi:hypothetical protein